MLAMQTKKHDVSEQQVHAIFAEHNLRCTRQRVVLYRALSATKEHPTADQLFQTMSQSDASISLATVYNTLEAFCRVGLAQKLQGPGGSARYDATTHNHLHMRDHKTGTVKDVPAGLSQQLLGAIPADVLDKLQREMGFTIDQVQIELVGEFA